MDRRVKPGGDTTFGEATSESSALSPVNSHPNPQQSFLLSPTLYSGHALLSEGVF